MSDNSTNDDIVFDEDNPEWTEADFARAIGPERLSPAELAAFPTTKAHVEGKRSRANKQQVTLRLSPDVLARFRATGKGWQTRIDQALRAHLGL